MEWLINLSILLLLCTLPPCLIRLVKGPTIMDRLLCMDGVAIAVIGIMILLSMKWHTKFYLDLVLVFSLLGFFGTVAFSYYLHRAASVRKDD